MPRAFTEYGTQGSASLLSPQQLRRTYLPRDFWNQCRCVHFLLTEQQQLLRTFSVRTRASVGRLSGGVHGSNYRRGRHRKRSDRVHEGDEQKLDDLRGKEVVDEPYSEDNDSHMFSDDVPYDKDIDRRVYHENAPFVDENCTDSPRSSTDIYDSIHGDSWQTDPYYQELENLEPENLEDEIARQGQALDGSFPDSSNNMDILDERNLVQISDVGNSQNQEYLMSVQDGNGGVTAYESITTSESSSVFPETATEGSSSPFDDTGKFVEDATFINSVKGNVAQDFEGDEQCSLDPEESSSPGHENSEDMVREVKRGERPSTSAGSLQNVEGAYLESRQCSGNSVLDEADLDCGSSGETGVIGSVEGSNTSNVAASACIAEIAEESGDLVMEVVTVTNSQALPIAKHVGEAVEEMAEESGDLVMEVATVTDAQALPVAEQVGQVVEQVADFLADSFKEQVGNMVDQVESLPSQVSQVAEQVMLKMVDQLPDPVVEQASQVADQVTHTAEQIVEQVTSQVVDPITSTASQIVNFLSNDDDDLTSDDEFEAYATLDIPEFKGRQGLSNFTTLQEEQGFLSIVYDFYIFMLKRSSLEFMLGMFAAPILLSMIFTILYLPEFSGLALDETIREAMQSSEGSLRGEILGLQLTWGTLFQVFMFSVSLSTGLQPELAPMSPYTLVVANLNALFAQLIFVFLSGAVFARLSQPSQPVKCSTIAIVCPPPSNRRLRKEACYKALLTRYVLVGPQPCELVDVKVDLTYNYNTITRSGTYFRTSQSLKLVRPEIAFLNNGMLVRHIIDESSPLYQRTQGMLEKEDAVFSLSVVGLERSSMQSVFHVQHYCVYDKDVVWDAEFVDMILISKKNRRVVDHSLLSQWRPLSVR